MKKTDSGALLEYAKSCVCDVSHGEGHISRVVKTALLLARAYPEADVRALEAAAILHDCAQAEQQRDPRVSHAAAGAEKARKKLIELGYGAEFADKAARLIAAHSSPELAARGGTEAKLLFDADKLDMVGAVGLSRALMYSLEHGGSLAGDDENSLARVAAADAEFVQKYLFTPEARRIAGERIELSLDFLQSLDREANIKD